MPFATCGFAVLEPIWLVKKKCCHIIEIYPSFKFSKQLQKKLCKGTNKKTKKGG